MLNLAGKLFVGALGTYALAQVVNHMRSNSQKSMYLDDLPIDFQQDLFRMTASDNWHGFNELLSYRGFPNDDTRSLLWNHYLSFTH